MVDVSRRRFLAGLGIAVAAPAIVHAGNLMPIKPGLLKVVAQRHPPEMTGIFLAPDVERDISAEMAHVIRRAFVPRLYAQLWTQSDLVSGLQIAAGA